jgi:hypothetical protein
MVDINLKASEDTFVDTQEGRYAFIDSDTIRNNEGHSVRLRGLAGPETAKLIEDKGWFSTDYNISEGQYKGALKTKQVKAIAKAGGYNKLVLTGESSYGRDVGDLVNDKGQTLTDRLIFEGIIDPATPEDGERMRQLGAFSRGLSGEGDDIYSQARAEDVQYDREHVLGWKQEAINEQELQEYSQARGMVSDGTWGQYVTNSVQYRHGDRDIMNQADSAFATGLESGLNNVISSAYGFASLVGDMVDSEELFEWGKRNAEHYEIENEALADYVNTIGDVNSLTDFGRYTAGMTGQMVPYLVGLFGAAVGGVAVATATGVAALGTGIAVGVPAIIYAGEAYQGMEGEMSERGVGWALSAGVASSLLDRLGLKGMLNVKDVLTKDIGEQLIKSYALKKGMTEDAARTFLQNQANARVVTAYQKMHGGTFQAAKQKVGNVTANIQKEMLDYLKDSASLTLNKRLLAKQLGQSFGTSGVKEAFTEMGQEGSIYAAQVLGSEKAFDADELGNILVNAAAGGFILGGAIGGFHGTGASYANFEQAKRDISISDGSQMEGFYGANTERNYQSLIDYANSELERTGSTLDVTEAGKKDYEEGSLLDTVKEKGVIKTVKELPGRFARKFGEIIQDKAEGLSDDAKFTLYTLLDNFAPSNTSHMAGVNMGKLKRSLIGSLNREIGNIESILLSKLEKRVGKRSKQDASDMLVKFQRLLEENGNKPLTAKQLPEDLRPYIHDLHEASAKINAATDTLLDIVEKQTGVEIGRQNNYFSNAIQLDANKIRKNKTSFIENVLIGYLGYSQANALEFYDSLVDSPKGYDPAKLEELGFQNTSGPKNLNKATARLKLFKGIDEFTYDNKFDQMVGIVESNINYAIDTKYLGKNNEKIDLALQTLKAQMGDKWDPRIAVWIKDSIAAERGDYKPIKNKYLREMQSWISWYNATTQLNTTLLASLPELAMVMLGKRAKSNAELILDASKGVGSKMLHDFRRMKAKVFKDTGFTEESENMAVEDFYRYQYAHGSQGAVAQFDIEMGTGRAREFREKTLEAFFKLNLLGPFTDATRIARLAMANDAIFTDIEIMINHFNGVDKISNYAADAFGRLRDLNVNPVDISTRYQKLVNKMKNDPNVDKTDSQAIHKYIMKNDPEMLEMLDIARKSYVDNALANPNPVDRPLWYSNQHFRLMTQYNGFLSTFSSHILPRVWKGIKEDNPHARYNGVAAVAGMLALGFIGQSLKDEVDREGKTPATLTDMGFYQRGLTASGLLGTSERFLNLVHPLYRSYETVPEQMFDEVAGPTSGSAGKIYRAMEALAEGDNLRPVQYGKLVPYGSTINSWGNIGRNIFGDK